MNIQKLKNFIIENNLPKFRFDQILKAIFKDGVLSFSEISTIPKDLREKMEKELNILSFRKEQILISKDEQSIKALLKLFDGSLIETVLISPKKDLWSACISCQVGCQMGCRFCATGKMGFKRNLTVEEITDQILFWRQFLKKEKIAGNFSNIVYMGMGEPFNNWENVSESLKNLVDEKIFGFGSRAISISTSGIVSGIEKIAQEFPQVNLAISLHFADDKKRNIFMPVNQKDNLESLKKALQKYFGITKRKIFLEYIMLDKINDTSLDAKNLATYIKSIGNVHLLHINLIRYNKTSENLSPSSKNKTQKFKKELEKYHISCTIRKSLGDEIKGACGQLAGK